MTKAQATKKVRELTQKTKKTLEEDAERLFECGGVDTEAFENDYELPKILITAAMENRKNDWELFQPSRAFKEYVAKSPEARPGGGIW